MGSEVCRQHPAQHLHPSTCAAFEHWAGGCDVANRAIDLARCIMVAVVGYMCLDGGGATAGAAPSGAGAVGRAAIGANKRPEWSCGALALQRALIGREMASRVGFTAGDRRAIPVVRGLDAQGRYPRRTSTANHSIASARRQLFGIRVARLRRPRHDGAGDIASTHGLLQVKLTLGSAKHPRRRERLL